MNDNFKHKASLISYIRSRFFVSFSDPSFMTMVPYGRRHYRVYRLNILRQIDYSPNKLLAYILHRKGFINIGHVYLVQFAFSGEERWIQFASQILAMHHCDRNVRSSVFTRMVTGTFTEKYIDFFLEQILLLIGDLRKHDFRNDPVSAEKVRAFGHAMYEAGIGLMIFRTRCAGLSKEEISAEISTVGSSREYVNSFTPEALGMQLSLLASMPKLF